MKRHDVIPNVRVVAVVRTADRMEYHISRYVEHANPKWDSYWWTWYYRDKVGSLLPNATVVCNYPGLYERMCHEEGLAEKDLLAALRQLRPR